ncbi:hypothetical protein Sfum_4036 [Syntrophobacter fumaroxidans MPOB]|uniref:Uncharacterized protein n=1 Tax=Syntrophobacter fumaroxidans (strain DSM 10017 / MPOB) TaxID=335543 RepID=A0LQK0_SYNFM|nr:hypothetical protein Sfum_4036 [Syntrophobacter fumaroxidans MPOB]
MRQGTIDSCRKDVVTPQPFPVHLLVELPRGAVPLDARLARTPLPGGPASAAPGGGILYGPYLEALAAFLARDSFAPLRNALSRLLDHPVPLEAVEAVRITSVKHGAIYHVARITAHVASTEYSLAANTAMEPAQQAFLENEFHVLQELQSASAPPRLPRACLLGEATYRDGSAPPRPFMLSILEWFEDFHEFHTSRGGPRKGPAVRVWAGTRDDLFLNAEQERILYGGASAILTDCLDTRDFRQIYPWHHAAGDFVVRLQGDDLRVRLITARDYRSLLALDNAPQAIWIGIAHFFLNLSMRMRLDRWEGTGDLAWAGAHILDGVIAGFVNAWSRKSEKLPQLPSAKEVMSVLRSFSEDEWLALAEIVLPQAMVEKEEIAFLEERLGTHVTELSSALAGDGFRERAGRIGA